MTWGPGLSAGGWHGAQAAQHRASQRWLALEGPWAGLSMDVFDRDKTSGGRRGEGEGGRRRKTLLSASTFPPIGFG